MKLVSILKKMVIAKRMIDGVRRNSKKISSNAVLSKKQRQSVRQYYKGLVHVNIPLDWHEYFYKRTDLFSVKYVPTSLYYTELIGRFNQFPMNEAYSDKNISDLILSGFPFPQIIVKNMNGYFYSGNKPISRAEAIEICSDLSEVIIKPSLKSHGDGVKKLSTVKGLVQPENISIENLFDEYGANFLIQKVIHQHERMNVLNPTSVNTIRVLTYRSGMDILVLYAVIRIGKMNASVDNESAGGISTSISPEGELSKYAYGAPGDDKIERTDTGILLEGYKIPSYDKVLELVKNAHMYLPHFNLIGWDVAIQEDGSPILIEFNTWPELSQSANGPAFGDYTELVFKEIWKKPNTRFQ